MSSSQNNSDPVDKVNDIDQPDHKNSGVQSASDKPGIFLMGLCRSGKTSIRKVVFEHLPPKGTSLLQSTNRIIRKDINKSGFLQARIWDFPGQMECADDLPDSDSIFCKCSALIFVIDVQDDYIEALAKLNQVIAKAFSVNQKIRFEVFIHKVDEMSDDFIGESQRDIRSQVAGGLTDAGLDKINVNFHLTSIFDHSIFEALSKVVQKLIPQLPALENLLNIFIQNSGIEKAFLFDVVSKIYVATDSSPVDMHSFALCCDMIDLVMDLSHLYGSKDDPGEAVFDEKSSSVVRMDNGMVLYLRQVSPFLALVSLVREESFSRQGVIDYNFLCFREAVAQVFEIGRT